MYDNRCKMSLLLSESPWTGSSVSIMRRAVLDLGTDRLRFVSPEVTRGRVFL